MIINTSVGIYSTPAKVLANKYCFRSINSIDSKDYNCIFLDIEIKNCQTELNDFIILILGLNHYIICKNGSNILQTL